MATCLIRGQKFGRLYNQRLVVWPLARSGTSNLDAELIGKLKTLVGLKKLKENIPSSHKLLPAYYCKTDVGSQ